MSLANVTTPTPGVAAGRKGQRGETNPVPASGLWPFLVFRTNREPDHNADHGQCRSENDDKRIGIESIHTGLPQRQKRADAGFGCGSLPRRRANRAAYLLKSGPPPPASTLKNQHHEGSEQHDVHRAL